MALRLYNTLSHELETFKPIESGKVRLYTCGPTVYAPAHIGNLRTFMFEDILRRYLEYRGYDVMHVMNITDIDDKTILQAISDDMPMGEMTEAITQKFQQDLKALNILPAHHLPKATKFVEQMKAGIQTLLDKGAAYVTDDGSVFYNIGKDAAYGQLVHIEPGELRQGARTADDDYGKDEARDFALWKAKKESDGPYSWDAPWGEGRPGWHMECSIMSSHYLGEHFDIHCGGVDNIFPHHENELAQSRSMFESKFVNYWIHSEHLIVDGEKMSKSLNNFYTLDDILGRGYSPEAIRYTLLSTHHRQQLNFSFDKVEESQKAINRLRELARRLEEVNDLGHEVERAVAIELPDAEFLAAMDNDLNIAGALGSVFGWAKNLFAALDNGALTQASAAEALTAIKRYDQLFGVVFFTELAGDEEQIELLVAERETARLNKDWQRADELRDELIGLGVILEDRASGTVWKRGKA